MISAPRDSSYYPAKIAVLNTDTIQGQNLVTIEIDRITGSILASTTATISFTMKPMTPEDPNYVRVWLFQGTDGKLYPAVATAQGELLIET